MKRVVLIGDSIRMGYEQTVRSALADVAEVFTSVENGGPTELVLSCLTENVTAHRPAWCISTPACTM